MITNDPLFSYSPCLPRKLEGAQLHGRTPGEEATHVMEILMGIFESAACAPAMGDTAILHCHWLSFLRDLYNHTNIAVIAAIFCRMTVSPRASASPPVATHPSIYHPTYPLNVHHVYELLFTTIHTKCADPACHTPPARRPPLCCSCCFRVV